MPGPLTAAAGTPRYSNSAAGSCGTTLTQKERDTKLKRILHRLLSPPERGTPKWRVITAAKKISDWLIDWLILAMAFLIIARACGAFAPAPIIGNYLVLALTLAFMARYTVGPVVWLLKKLAGYPAEEDRNA